MAKQSKKSLDVGNFLASNAGTNPGKPKKGAVPELSGHEALADKAYNAYKTSKDAEAAYKALEAEILGVVSPAYEANARAGAFSKSFNLPGEETAGMQVSYKDQFSPMTMEQEPHIRERLGDKYDAYFEQKRELSLIDTSDETIKLLIKKLGEDEFRRIFEIKLAIIAKPDMDRRQYELPDDVRIFALKQYKPSLKSR